MKKMHTTPLALSVVFLLTLGACSKKDKDDYVERPVGVLYNEAQALFKTQSYEKAAKAFEEVERQHPYSPWAKKAQLMAAFAHFTREHYEDSLDILERFIQLYPSDDDTAYAYYLRALCSYERISDITRDQKMTLTALETLEEVVKRFPGTSYAEDAQYKIDLTKDHIAGKEMQIGRFYQKQKEFLAAIPRFQKVVQDYQTTSHIEEALYRLVEANVSLGIMDEAKKSAAVLHFNYPKSKWYKMAFRLLEGKNIKMKDVTDSWLQQSRVWIDKTIL